MMVWGKQYSKNPQSVSERGGGLSEIDPLVNENGVQVLALVPYRIMSRSGFIPYA